MGKLYHYTKSEVLKKITIKDGIILKSTRYDRHGNGEYSWIKEKADLAIKEICKEKGKPYDEDPLQFVPFTISLCCNGYLKNMWENYAEGCQGVQLLLDFERIEKLALSDHNPNVFIPCHYMNVEDDVKAALIDMYNKHYKPESNDLQSDLTECSACLKQMQYKKEDEYRFLIPHYNKLSASYNDGNIHIEEKENEEGLSDCNDELTYMQYFPKDVLLGVVVGHLITDEKMEELKQHLLLNGYESVANTIKRIDEKEYV